ncbi:hypothetical protein AMTR_s00154p00048010 [Amborella trichopoda]|uniref:non-specific serine/threonine protein kinase n=1 Tax=Amborella trichopoda TaxID=13333 RepID=W1PK93_AMBTC|nr:hypothetical protein AMTR_s00154p00048010 [Amborella trichopoda]
MLLPVKLSPGFPWRWRLSKTLTLFQTLILALLLQPWLSAGVAGYKEDMAALLDFKAYVAPGSSGFLSNWNPNDPDPCSWTGITCDSTKFRVSAIRIAGSDCFKAFSLASHGGCNCNSESVSGNGSSCKIRAQLPGSLGNLTWLRVLSLPFNDLYGEVPREIGSLKLLEELELEGNSLSGNLPMELGLLSSLRVVNLGYNRFTGSIPASLSGCPNLQILNLAGNLLNGTLPDFLGKFSNLRGVFLSFNQLSGSISGDIGNNCEFLEHLHLMGNYFTGGIPSNFGNCSRLRSLLLSSNILDGGIPPDLGRLSALEVLDISRNSLSGHIPSDLGNCKNLSVLILSNEYDPQMFGKEHSLMDSFSGFSSDDKGEFNYFEGGIPDSLANLSMIRIIWAPKATLDGPLPKYWGACKSLQMINLGGNFFNGEFPYSFHECKDMYYFDLSSNKLTGVLTEKLLVPCMGLFNVSGNSLSGDIPKFLETGCPPIPSFVVEKQGQLPSNGLYGQWDYSSVYMSFFACNARSGSSMPYLETDNLPIFHDFSWNNFTGSVPLLPIVAPVRLEMDPLYAFLASGNNISGKLPGYVFETCDILSGMILNLSRNSISGELPEVASNGCISMKQLDVSENRIVGFLPPSFGNLLSLESLDLSRNLLSGQIPMQFGQLKNLRYLSLAGNTLTGGIPSGLAQLPSLQVLELSSNFLTGKIPDGFAGLKNLTSILLDNNKLSGQIPSSFSKMTSLSVFNVSFNNLSGPIPRNVTSVRCDSVLGNPLLLESCHLASQSGPSTEQQGQSGSNTQYAYSPSESVSRKNSGFNPIEIASITSASLIVSVLLALIFLFVYTRKCIPRSSGQGSGRREVITFSNIGVSLTFESVVRATGGFNARNCIGNGGFGATYKAEMAPGTLVAIKRLSVGRFQGVQQFDAEIKTLGRVRHPNLVTLIGYHASETEMFLIYNYLPGGNLEKFIQERSKRTVDWRMLHKIALDIARALAYLHDECVPRVLHRDIKPSNILLDNNYNAYLSDFGLARLLGTSETHATTDVAGTFGYVAPEYAMTCRVSDKADVYSYGVVLLELLSDKKALDPSFSSYGNGFNIVQWACMLLRQGQAREVFTAGLWDVGPHDDLVETLHLAVMCTFESLSVRPSMKQVVQRLKQLQPPTC